MYNDFLRVGCTVQVKEQQVKPTTQFQPCCVEHVSVKMTIPPICIQGTQSYCAQPLAKALQSGMSND